MVDTPQALTVLPSDFLRIANIDDSSGIADFTAGLQDAGLGDGTQVIINSRGFQINRERGFKLNNLSIDSEIDLDYFAMERVEVVRGPASALYGEVDYGATFNRVLKRPGNSFATSASLEVGSFDAYRAELDIQSPLGQSDRVAGRLLLAVQDSETFIRDT